MKFDTFLKVGSYMADLWKHDSFQQMSKMVHKGVKRRMQNQDSYMQNYYSQQEPFGKNFKNRNLQILDPTKQPQQSKINWDEYLTPENIQSAFQLHQTIKKIINNKK